MPGGRTHLLVVPGVHSNRSVEEVLNPSASNHKAFRENIHHFYHCSPKVTNNSKLQVSFGTRSKECRKSLWKLALNNNNNKIITIIIVTTFPPSYYNINKWKPTWRRRTQAWSLMTSKWWMEGRCTNNQSYSCSGDDDAGEDCAWVSSSSLLTSSSCGLLSTNDKHCNELQIVTKRHQQV